MKSSKKLRLNTPSAPNGEDSLAHSLQRVEELKAARRRRSTLLRSALMVAAFLIVSIFLIQEGLKPDPEEKTEITETTPTKKPKKATPTKEAPTPPPAIAEKPAETPKIIPQEAPVEPEPVEIPDNKTIAEGKIAKADNLLLVGLNATREADRKNDTELLHLAVKEGAWDAYRNLLQKSLQSGLADIRLGQGTNLFSSVWQEPHLYQAFLRWKTLGCFTESEITELISDNYNGNMLIWLLQNNQAMEELLLTISPKDDSGKVLKFLTDAWAVSEAQFEKYFSLALACAVVFDRPVTIENPIGEGAYGEETHVNPNKRYLWFIEKNEAGKLTAPIHRSSARDLIWVVCAPVSISEMEWAVKKVRYSRKNWGNAYGSVEYLMERAVEGLNPYDEYSFAEILKKGGICGDQSYFCVNTARANGIPAMILGGMTDVGAHAWAGLKIDSNKWSTSAGRIGGTSKGTTNNPQTGESITEQEILQWNDRSQTSTNTTLAVWRHLWIADFYASIKDDEKQADAITIANRIGRAFTETWLALHTLLKDQMKMVGDPEEPSNLEDWKLFVRDMRQQFKKNPRMAQLAADAELEYVFPYVDDNVAKRSLLRERRRLNRDAGEQADLIATSLKRNAELIHKRGGPDASKEISQLYSSALRTYGGSITGFRMMAEDYFGYMRGDPEARKAVRHIELAFGRVVETGSKDWFRANTESDLYRQICNYYREAGDTKRAEFLEKRIETLLRRAKRKAL